MLDTVIAFSVLLSFVPFPIGLLMQYGAFVEFNNNLKKGYIDRENDSSMFFLMWGYFNLSAIPWFFAGRDEVYFVVSISLCVLTYCLLHLMLPSKKQFNDRFSKKRGF